MICGLVDFDLWICGFVDLWICGFVDLWIYGKINMWVVRPPTFYFTKKYSNLFAYPTVWNPFQTICNEKSS